MNRTTSVEGASVPVHNHDGVVVGEIRQGGTGMELRKHVDPARHQLRRPLGWALSVEHLELLRRFGGPDATVVLEARDGRRWTTTVAEFDSHGIRLGIDGRGRGGHEPQTVLPLRFWHVVLPGAHQPALFGGDAAWD